MGALIVIWTWSSAHLHGDACPPIAEEVPGMSCPPSSFFTTLLRVIDRAWLEKVEGGEKVAWPKREIGSKLSLREQCPGRGSL